MYWLLGFLVILVLLSAWLLVSALELRLDTRALQAELNWRTIGRVQVWHEQQWLIQFRIFFFSKTLPISELKGTKGKPKKVKTETKAGRPFRFKNIPGRMINVIRSFEVLECTLAIDTGDHCRNAQLYPLNHIPYARGHLFVNFNDENYFVLKIRNRPWRILNAFFRRSFV